MFSNLQLFYIYIPDLGDNQMKESSCMLSSAEPAVSIQNDSQSNLSPRRCPTTIAITLVLPLTVFHVHTFMHQTSVKMN